MTTPMTTWIMEPRDPLLVRDGRPFGADPGARAMSLPFPFPSTIAGGIRARAGANAEGIFQHVGDKAQLQRLRELRIHGPLLVEFTEDKMEIESASWLLPAPRDVQLFKPQSGTTTPFMQRLVPTRLPDGAQTDLDQAQLFFLGPANKAKPGKPLPQPPAYWRWEHFQTWLRAPDELVAQQLSEEQFGLKNLTREFRSHVSIEGETETAKEGMLFTTSGLEFTDPGVETQRPRKMRRLAIVIGVEDSGYTIQPGLASFSGERRLVTWRKSSAALPACPADLAETIAQTGFCRLFLLTPACFTQGYLPTWLQMDAADRGVRIDPQAIAIGRPQVVSGWDLELRQPKRSRRLAPSGTVLFLKLNGSEEARKEWIETTWLQCVSDEEQDRRDGFGLAMLGAWDGQAIQMGKE